MLFEIIASSLFIVALSFVGIILLALKHDILKKYMWLLIAFASGTLLSAAFLHLIPEAFASFGNAPIFILSGIFMSYILESVLHWHHCRGECVSHVKPVAYLILIADAVHNFIDGLILAAAYLADFHLGVLTTIAIAAHEVPQELSDFVILLKGGYEKKKALLLNFSAAITIVLGALTTYFFAQSGEYIPILLSFAAGNFIYLSLSDLVPELHKKSSTKETIAKIAMFLIGIALLYFISGIIPEVH
jgi:zinc and cadmium transporter